MKPVSSSTSGLELNTDRIAAASKQRQVRSLPSAKQEAYDSPLTSFKRERPISNNAEFVEIDGKRYFLNAPRGTYVNIII